MTLEEMNSNSVAYRKRKKLEKEHERQKIPKERQIITVRKATLLFKNGRTTLYRTHINYFCH